LFAQTRFAGEGDHAVAVMIKEIVGKDPLANAKREVSGAASFNDYFRKRFADLHKSLASRV
jgi:hypothetical protein